MFSAIFFDLDGTLIDSEVLWVGAVGRMLCEASCPLPHEEVIDYVYGRAWGDIFVDLQQRFPAVFSDYQAVSAVISQHFHALRQTMDISIHGSIETLIHLAGTYPVAIVSGSTRTGITREVEMLGLAPYLRFFLGSEDYAPGKPHPACFLLAAERLGVPPESCLVFEDSTYGVQAAKRAGMTCIALQRPGQPPQDHSAADYTVHDLRESLALIG